MPDDIAEEIAARRREQNEEQQEVPLSVTPPPTVANGGVDPIADSIASRRKVALASSVHAGVAANPDTRARALALASELQFPVDVVERNLPEVEQKARRSKYHLDALRKNHPELADWLTDPNNAAVSNDDLPAMRSIDVATRALRGDDPSGVLPKGFLFSGDAIVEPLGDGSLANQYKTIQELQAELTRRGERHDWQEWERQEQAQALKDRWGPLAVAGGGAEAATISTLRALSFAGRERGNYLEREADASSQASATLDPSIWGDFQRGLGGVAADLPLMAAGGPVVRGLQSLSRLGRARAMVTALEKATPANRELGGSFARLSAERGAARVAVGEAEAGALLKGRAADMAATAATVQPIAIREGVNTAEDNGAANGAMAWLIETAIPGAFGKTGLERAFVPGATDVAAKGWRGVVAQGLRDAGYEATEEAITEWAHAVHEAASGIDPDALDPDRLARRLVVAGAVGGVAGGITQVPVAIAEKMFGDQEEARRASVHADRLMSLTKSIAASKTNERAAPVVKDAIERSLGQSDRFQYVDPQDFRDAYPDPAAAAAAMGLTKEYAEALAAGTPIKIPTATLVQTAAKDEATAKLIGKARRSPDAWSAEQAAEFHDQAPDQVRRLAAEANASAAAAKQTPEDAEANVRSDIEAKLTKAGHDPVRAKTNATLMARQFAALAKRSGKDARDLFAQYLDGNIKKVLPKLMKGEKFDLVDAMLDRIRNGEVPTDKQVNGPSLVDFLRTKGLRDTSLAGELKQLKESDNTRLPGERSLIRDDGITLDEARELAADAGYLPADATLNDFMALVDDEVRGNSPTYIENNGDPNQKAVRESLDQLAAALAEAGVDPLTATNKQAREALAKMLEEQDGKSLNQGASVTAPKSGRLDLDALLRQWRKATGDRTPIGGDAAFQALADESDAVDAANGKSYQQPAYHGTGNASPYDALRYDKVNAAGGEGTQFEGWGIYVTGSEGVGKYYRKQNTRIVQQQTKTKAAPEAERAFIKENVDSLHEFVDAQGWSPEIKKEVFKELRREYVEGIIDPQYLKEYAETLPSSKSDLSNLYNKTDPEDLDDILHWMDDENKESLDFAIAMKSGIGHLLGRGYEKEYRDLYGIPGNGLLYKVELPDDDGTNYLDWNKVTGSQSEEIQERLDEAFRKNASDQAITWWEEEGHQMNGGEVYGKLESDLGSAKAASDALRGAGIVGNKYHGGQHDGGAGSKRRPDYHNYVVFQDVPVVEYNQPKGAGTGPRGSLVFGKTGTPFTIKLFQSENLSTFAHESAHLQLEILGDLALAAGAAPDLVEDYRAVRDWFKANAKDIRKQARDLAKDRGAPAHVITNGIENLTDEEVGAIADDFHSPPADGTAGSYVHEAMHEYYARGFEAYLLEGRAPTASLRSVFARIKGWMVAIYRIVSTLGVELSPEIRGVFDRLLTIEDETDAADERAGTKDILPADAFPDLATYDEYRKAVQANYDAVQDSLAKQLLADYRREFARAQTEQREEIRAEVAAEVNAQPVYQVIAALQRAQLPEGGQVDEYVGMKLDREELVREWGEIILKKLPGPADISENDANRGAVVYATENGMSIATVAQTFGFSDPSAMIEAMVAAPDRVSLIETTTAKRMREEHPDPFLDGSLPERADQAIHSEMRGELLAREIRALGMKTGQTPAPVAVLREFARDTIEKQVARDLRPAVYKAAAATAARRSREAAGKQDWGTAYVEAQREALNLEMYRAARDAVEAGEKSRDYLRSLNTLAARQRIGKAGGWEFTVFDASGADVATYATADEAREAVLPGQSFRQTNGYLEQIDAIQDGYSLRRTSNRALRKGEMLRKWVAKQQEDNPGFEIDSRIASDLDVGNVNWNDLTVLQQAEVVDAVKKIENLAKLKNKLLKAKRDRDLAAAQAEGAASITANKKGNAPKTEQGDTITESGARSGKGFLGWHRKDSFLIRQMDGYKDAGVMWELIQRPRNDAATDEEARNLVNAAKVEDAFKKWGKGLGWTRQEIAGTKLRLTLEHRIAIALNWGHAEGRRRILRQLEEDGLDQRDVQAVLDSLDDKDFALVSDLVGIINSHWSEVADLERRLNGIPPEKVKALPFSSRNPVTGKVTWHDGGYYPLKYDVEKSKRGGDAAVVAALTENRNAAGARGQTRRSHTKQRVEDVKGLVVDLSIDVAGKHLAEVVHDLTHREMVRDQIQLLKDGTPIANAIIQKYGIAKLKQLVETTGAIATRDVQPDNKVSRFIRMVRRGNTAATFTYQLTSALMNLTGVVSSIARVGPLRLLSAVASVTKDAATMEWAGTWVQGKSDLMKVRGGNNVREVSEALREIGHLSPLQKAIRIGYLPMQKVVQLVDTITWIAAYRQHMEVALAQGKTESEADELSIAVADQTVIDTQGSGRIGDLSAIQRGGELAKLFTMFYGYFNVQANLIGEQVGRAREEGGAQWIRSATTIVMVGPVATVLTNLIKAALRGDERDEDAEETARRMALEQLSAAAGLLVGVRELSGAIEAGFGYSGPASLSAFGNATKLIQDVKQGDLDGIAKGAISTVGSLTGAPSRVANQWLDAFLQFEEDGKGGRALRTMLFGKPLREQK